MQEAKDEFGDMSAFLSTTDFHELVISSKNYSTPDFLLNLTSCSSELRSDSPFGGDHLSSSSTPSDLRQTDNNDNNSESPFSKDPTNPRIPTTPIPVVPESSTRRMPLHGNPDVSQLVDKTNLDSDLKGDPKVEQFNPTILTHTEIAKPGRTLSRPPAPPTTPTSKTQSDTDRKKRILDHSSVSTRADKTILNRHLTGDPTDGQSNPSHQPYIAIPLLPLSRPLCSASGPTPTTPNVVIQAPNPNHPAETPIPLNIWHPLHDDLAPNPNHPAETPIPLNIWSPLHDDLDLPSSQEEDLDGASSQEEETVSDTSADQEEDPILSTPDPPTNKADALPEAQQLTTKGGRSDDQRK